MTRNELQKIRYYLDLLGIPVNSNFSIVDVDNFYQTQANIVHPNANKVENAHEKYSDLTRARDYIKNNFNYVKDLIRNNPGYFNSTGYENTPQSSPNYTTRNYGVDDTREKEQKKHNRRGKDKNEPNKKKDKGNGASLILIKIFRTIGYGLMTFGLAISLMISFILLSEYLATYTTFLLEIAKPFATMLENSPFPNIVFYALLSVFIGTFLVVITGQKNMARKIVFSVGLVLILAYFIFFPDSSILFYTLRAKTLREVVSDVAVVVVDPEGLLNNALLRPDFLTDFTTKFADQLNAFDSLVPYGLMGGIITVFYVLAALSAVGKRKPRRLSSSLVKGGHGLLTFIVIVGGILLPLISGLLSLDLTTYNIYLIVVYAFLTLSYVFQLIGSALGTILFFVK